MNRVSVTGAALLGAGFLGYAVGVEAAYPGRAFSVTAVMVGVAVLALGAGGGSS
ncbi:MAG: hypothetical protein ABEJ42_09690 [Halobacteriaceae archaeon]